MFIKNCSIIFLDQWFSLVLILNEVARLQETRIKWPVALSRNALKFLCLMQDKTTVSID